MVESEWYSGVFGVHPINFGGTNSYLKYILMVSLWNEMVIDQLISFHRTKYKKVMSEKMMDHLIPRTKHTHCDLCSVSAWRT